MVIVNCWILLFSLLSQLVLVSWTQKNWKLTLQKVVLLALKAEVEKQNKTKPYPQNTVNNCPELGGRKTVKSR